MLRIVILTIICIFICYAFAGDSYQESNPGNEKLKSEVSGSYRVTKHRKNRHIHGLKENRLKLFGSRWRKSNNLKHLFGRNEEHCISKKVKGNALVSKVKSCRPETTPA